MANVKIVKVIPNTNMGGVHRLRGSVSCGHSEGWLFVNKRRTIARVINGSRRCVLTVYAREFEVIDLPILQQLVSDVRLHLLVPAGTDHSFGAPVNRRAKRAA